MRGLLHPLEALCLENRRCPRTEQVFDEGFGGIGLSAAMTYDTKPERIIFSSKQWGRTRIAARPRRQVYI
jgi:hypothetical protein